MSYTHYADTLITLMLGWIRALTDWIWNIVSLGDGSAGKSFLTWFGANWPKVVLLMLVIGLAADWLIWLVRWKPYWVWFGKKRRILEDAGAPADSRTPRKPARKTHAPEISRKRETAAQRDPDRDEGRVPAPRFQSKALPRKSAAPAKTPAYTEPDFAEDDLFDVISPEVAPPKEPPRKPRKDEDWIRQYVREDAKPNADTADIEQTKRKKADEIDWFDS